MAMRPCEKCLENNWKLDHHQTSNEQPDGSHLRESYMTADCQSCGNQVEFGHEQKVMHTKEQKGKYLIRDGKHYWDAEDGSKLVEMDVFKINKKGRKDHSGKVMKVMAV